MRWGRVRPRSIVFFERLFLASLAIGIVQAAAGWETLAARAAAGGHRTGALAALLGLTFFTLGGMALLASRGRSRAAKWVLTALCLIGLPLLAGSLAAGTVVGWPALAIAQGALQVASLALLFTREARGWLRGAEGGESNRRK